MTDDTCRQMLLDAILVICTDEVVVDTLWMPDIEQTVVDALSKVAVSLGASDDDIRAVTHS